MPKTKRELTWLGLAILLLPTVLRAQQNTDTDRIHLDLTPLLGYRTTVSLPLENSVHGSNSRIMFDSGPSYGLAAGMRFHDEDVIEFRWARQDSHTRLQHANFVSSRQRATVDQFHGDFAHEYVPDEWPKWARPYILGSVGATHISGKGNTNFTRFSFGLGGGIKFFTGQHLGFRIQAEWLPIVVNPYARVFCGGGCIVHVGGTIGSQGEVVIGPLLRF